MFTTNKHYKATTNQRMRVKSRYFCIQPADKTNYLLRNPLTHESTRILKQKLNKIKIHTVLK